MRRPLGIAIIGTINAFKLNLFEVHISLKGLFQKIVQIFVSLNIVRIVIPIRLHSKTVQLPS